MAKTGDAAIEAMRHDAYNDPVIPLDPHHLRRVVGEAPEMARRMRRPALVAETALDPALYGNIVGRCAAVARCPRPSAASPPGTCPSRSPGRARPGNNGLLAGHLRDDVCGAHAEDRVEIALRERVVQVAKSPLVLRCHDRSPRSVKGAR